MNLVETIVSMALTLVLSGTIMSLVVAGQAIARTQPEAADLQQRARVAVRAIGAAVRDAGAGLERGTMSGSLLGFFPAIAPSPDGGLMLWTATNRHAQGAPAMSVLPGATAIALQDSESCSPARPACGFSAGTSAIAFTAAGCRTTLRVAATTADSLQLAAPLAGCTLDPASAVAEGEVRTYRLDAAARQLVRRDEATGTSAPLLDGVTAFTVAYYADTAASEPIAGTSDADLVRVRLIRLTLRFAASNALLAIPDLTVTVDAAPRNPRGA